MTSGPRGSGRGVALGLIKVAGVSCRPLCAECDSAVTHHCTPNRSKPVTSSSVGLSSSSSLEFGLSGAHLFGELPARGVPGVLPSALFS